MAVIPALGLSVPPDTPHAISVSLPTWRDNVGYEEGEKRVVDSMVSGYPRFFIHLSIRKLSEICEQKYAVDNERCMLFPTNKIAHECRDFMKRRSVQLGYEPTQARIVHLFICPEVTNGTVTPSTRHSSADLHIVLFPISAFSIAKEFWQHTGLGISSRLAEKCLSLLAGCAQGGDNTTIEKARPSSPIPRFPHKAGHNRHYSVKSSDFQNNVNPWTQESSTTTIPAASSTPNDLLSSDHAEYLEERYGRNLPLEAAASAKRALRRRVAGVLIRDNGSDRSIESYAGQESTQTGPSSRGVANVTEDDVYLFPCGMAAIWNAHKLAREVRPDGKSVCFGFPYTDTLKILQKWGPGAHFFGNGLDDDINALEALLERESHLDPSQPPILALFTEFPSNPLLRSANLPRLRALADKYDFLVVVDETIGNFVNVEVLPYADIVVSSLTKVFSGASNVMGGSLVLNPRGRHYLALKTHLTQSFEDVYFDEDAIYMERNSRDFKRRIKIIDANTEAICDFLHSRSVAGGCNESNTAIKNVFYPKYTIPEHYETCRIKTTTNEREGGGYGGLFSLTFTSETASQAFFDALPCYKGPSLGTNFTLACPYTILAHFGELDWAAGFGVESGLVRISVGMEELAELMRCFKLALEAAEGCY